MARLLYDVFWKKHPQEFAKYTFGKWIIATCGIEVTPKLDVPGGLTIEAKEAYVNWGDRPKAVKMGGRDPSDFKSRWETEQERLAKEIKLLQDEVTMAQLYGGDVKAKLAELNKKRNQLKPKSPQPDDLDKLMDEAKKKREKELELYIEGKGPEPGPLPTWNELQEKLDEMGKGTPVLVASGDEGSSEIP
jgi:hypothetical protein